MLTALTKVHEDIAATFSVFHDGTPGEWSFNNHVLSLRVSCAYIAELISPGFEFFYVELAGTRTFEFVPWVLDEKDKVSITDLSEIAKGDFEINDAEVIGNHVEVNCNECSGRFGSPGGNFKIAAEQITIRSEDLRTITLTDLELLIKTRWSAAGNMGRKD